MADNEAGDIVGYTWLRVKSEQIFFKEIFLYVCTYSKEQVKPITCPIMKQNADSQEGILQAQSSGTPLTIAKKFNH